jgi:hypothetical protein
MNIPILLTCTIVLASTLSCASTSALDAQLAAGQALIVPAESYACEAATDIDPTGATALCTEIDAAGNAIGAGITVVEEVGWIANLIKNTIGKTDATKQALSQFHAIKRVAKGVKK